MDRFSTRFRRFPVKDAPEADKLLNLCKETIQKLSAQYLSSSTEDDRTEDYLMNRHQCKVLVGRLTDTRDILQKIQLSPLLDEKSIPVLQELHQVLLDVETVINASRITSSEWPRAAIEQSDMKETFARLLYGVQWHASVLHSILLDNSQESCITFEPALCEGQLGVGDEFSLLTAMKEDEESLKDRLRSVKLDDPTEKRLANELLRLKMLSEKEDNRNTYQLHENSDASKDLESSSVADDSTGSSLVASARDILFLNPLELHVNGPLLGQGGFARVKRMNLMGGKYAIKIFQTSPSISFDQEITALQRLGHHPHIVRLLYYSKDDRGCFLIMEEMDQNLHEFLFATSKRLPNVQAVALMLRIGEGVKYIHSKGMAHRDLKSMNVLVNLSSDPSSRIIAVKIADFGLSKTKNASQTHSHQTYNQGTSYWMAPEVIQGDDPEDHSRFNLRKADVYSFAIMCSEILTRNAPFVDFAGTQKRIKEQVKAGTLRPNLPEKCPPKLAALIRRCWHPDPQERPLFPEICKELRYIKGLLLTGDRGTLEKQDILPLRPGPLGSLERVQIQGPWGGPGGLKFLDMGTSINRIKLRYSRLVGLMDVEYNIAGSHFVRSYCAVTSKRGNLYTEMVFQPFEFITRISGYVSQISGRSADGKEAAIDCVTSLTIHTNIKRYGPFGDEEGVPFASGTGRVIGFHGQGCTVLDSLGVVILLDD